LLLFDAGKRRSEEQRRKITCIQKKARNTSSTAGSLNNHIGQSATRQQQGAHTNRASTFTKAESPLQLIKQASRQGTKQAEGRKAFTSYYCTKRETKTREQGREASEQRRG